MIRWTSPDAERLHPQEQALLALFDRVQMLEQLFVVEMDHNRAMRRKLERLEAELASLTAILEREE